MNVEPAVKQIIENRGLRQVWVIKQMNLANPALGMNRSKLSAIVCGNRRMTGDELLAFCMATDTDPDYFCKAASSAGEPGHEGR